MRILPVQLRNTSEIVNTYALLDDGAKATLIDRKIVQQLDLEVTRTNVVIRGISGPNALLLCNGKTNFQIVHDGSKYPLDNVIVVTNLQLPRQSISESLVSVCRKKTGVSVSPYDAVPRLLIGQDHCRLIIAREFRTIMNQALFTSRCLLGWAIHGQLQVIETHFSEPLVTTSKTKPPHSNVAPVLLTDSPCKSFSNRLDAELLALMKNYFDLDSIGIKNYGNTDPEESRALRILDNTSRYMHGFWEVGLLWRKDYDQLPLSRASALRRLRLLEDRFDRDSEYAELYYKEVDGLLECGFAEKVSKSPSSNKLFYLPHFGVQKINRPGKVRLVFDAAARASGSSSFNDLLLTGPDFLKSLLGVLMRFRQYVFALKSDIKDMFMKVSVIPEDRDTQRFVWREQTDLVILQNLE